MSAENIKSPHGASSQLF